MPQLNKGGKFVFGQSMVHDDGSLVIPAQAVAEYAIVTEGKIYFFTGSKSTGGFCVTRKGLFLPSKLGFVLEALPSLLDYSLREGDLLPYKGRSYGWLTIDTVGKVVLPPDTMEKLGIKAGMKLLSIRSSDIAFTMGAKGPLLEKASVYQGSIPQF